MSRLDSVAALPFFLHALRNARKFAKISRRFVSAKWDVKVWSNAAQAFCCHPVSVYVYSKQASQLQANAGVGVLIWSHIRETATVKTYFC